MTTLATGDAPPAFALTDQHGATVRLEDFHGHEVLALAQPV